MVRKAENCVAPSPKVVPSPGDMPGCETTGMMVRVIRFQSFDNSMGMTGWMFRMFCVWLRGP